MSYEIFEGTAHLLKLAVARRSRRGSPRDAFVFHSWRAVLEGRDEPLDANELQAFCEIRPVDLFLVGERSHVDQIEQRFGKPAIVLPYTLFLPDFFRYEGEEAQYDVVFSCMFRPDQIERKYAHAFLDFARAHRDVRAAWIGGYSVYDRWVMENAFNKFLLGAPPPEHWLAPWEERECVHCWHDGVEVFPSAMAQLGEFETYRQIVESEGLNISMYCGLARDQVAHLLKRSRCALVLSERDQWPRCTTESVASGAPVVAYEGLASGLALLNETNGVTLSSREPDCIREALEAAWRLDRRQISDRFFNVWGLDNCVRTVVGSLKRQGVAWDRILDWQRPFERTLKEAVRRSYPG